MKQGMRRGKDRSFCWIIGMILFFSIPSGAQEIKVSGGFLKDSIQIGEPIEYYLTVSYPQSLTVLYPDSTYSFEPFEFNKKKYFQTHTTNGVSYDSVLYSLSTFEVDKIQYLELPVFVATARDCTAYTPTPDSVYLIELVKSPPPDSIQAQNLPLKINTLYERVFTQFNYIILLIIGGILLVSALVVWIVFGKKIITYFKLRRLQKKHMKFLNDFSYYLQQLNSDFSSEKTEHTVSLWKKYLEQLEQKPYTKLTTRETMRLEHNEQLGNYLQMIDRAIYGNQIAVLEPLKQLQQFAEERFHKKMEEIKHG